MQKLHPVASKATRHLFIDPLLCRPTFISAEGYVTGEMTSFIKPGKVPNLVDLCCPEDMKLTVTEEPNIETMKVAEVIFGARNYNGDWTVCHIKRLNSKLAKDGPGRAILKGYIVAPLERIYDPLNPDENVLFLEDQPLVIEIDLLYERATRTLTLKTPEDAGFDTGKPQILGIRLDLDYHDAKIV